MTEVKAPKIDVKQELNRRASIRKSMLRMFQEQGELSTWEMNKYFGTGCSSRLHELREEGHVIVATYERPGHYRYTYLGNKSDDGTKVGSVDWYERSIIRTL